MVGVPVVEYRIEEEVVEELVEEEMEKVEREVEMEVVAAVELAVGRVDSEETYRRGLPRDHWDEMAQSTSFWRPLPNCISSSSNLPWCP